MNRKPKVKSSIKLVTTALAAGGFIVGSAASAATSDVFAMEELDQGYMIADSHGGERGDKDKDDDCEKRDGEGHCGGEGKDGEGKCGEGKCGEGKDGEGKCGEGKCGN